MGSFAKKSFYRLTDLGLLNCIPDRLYLKIIFLLRVGKPLRLSPPRTYTEKLQWLKLYNRNPLYTMMADKYRVREYIAKEIGREHLVPLLGVWDSADEIDFDTLPDQFVLKCSHNSGEGMFICRDKASFDTEAARAAINAALKKNYFWWGREWVYKDIPPRVLCEKLLSDTSPANNTGSPVGFKFLCFDGEPKFLYVATNDFTDGTKGHTKMTYYYPDWSTPEFYRTDKEPAALKMKRPENLDEMLRIARKLSKGIPFVRVDLYNVDGNIYFSELTFYPGSGFCCFSPKEWEYKIGSWIPTDSAAEKNGVSAG